MKLLLGTVAGLIAAGGVPLEALDPVARLGAVGVLGAALLYQIKTNRESMKEVSKSLTALQVQCAATCKGSEP